jgi:hypothetical protein
LILFFILGSKILKEMNTNNEILSTTPDRPFSPLGPSMNIYTENSTILVMKNPPSCLSEKELLDKCIVKYNSNNKCMSEVIDFTLCIFGFPTSTGKK